MIYGRYKVLKILTFALLIVAIDLILAHYSILHFWKAIILRFCVAAAALIFTKRLAHNQWGILFSSIRPVQGWKFWIRTSVIVGIGVIFIIGGSFLSWKLLYGKYPEAAKLWHFSSMYDFWNWWVLQCCLIILIVEEIIYRGVLCLVIGEIAGKFWGIFVSGVAFGILHFVYQAAEPENIIGGFILAWAFYKSRSFLVPLLLHSGGNLFIGLVHLMNPSKGWKF